MQLLLNMVSFKGLLIFVFLVGPSFCQWPQAQIQLFDQNGGQGQSTNVFIGSVNDLVLQGFDNRARSICGTGVWVFYQDANFHPNGQRPVEWKFNRYYRCVNLQIVGGRLSSVRYAGSSEDYRTNSITFYQHDHFQGIQHYVIDYLDNIYADEAKFKYVIVTGNCDWTVYSEPNFGGVAVCLRMAAPRDFTPSFSTDPPGMFGPILLKDGIRSVRMGCPTGILTYVLNRFPTN